MDVGLSGQVLGVGLKGRWSKGTWVLGDVGQRGRNRLGYYAIKGICDVLRNSCFCELIRKGKGRAYMFSNNFRSGLTIIGI